MTFAIKHCFDSVDNVCLITLSKGFLRQAFLFTRGGRNLYYVLLIFFGILGALARYSIELTLPTTSFPLATLFINLLGCFLLAFVVRFLIWLPRLSSKMVTAIGTGFVGSFTTFSTFALESSILSRTHFLIAAGYMIASLIGGLLACVLGYRLSKMLLIRFKEVLRHDH